MVRVDPVIVRLAYIGGLDQCLSGGLFHDHGVVSSLSDGAQWKRNNMQSKARHNR